MKRRVIRAVRLAGVVDRLRRTDDRQIVCALL
jgi:hypothetical protein